MYTILNGSSTSADMHVGVLSNSELRQVKNLFICTTTLVTRAAIEGGLELKTAYQLSDLYLRKIENAASIAALKEPMHLSKSQIDRRFKKTLGFSPSEFILRCKLEEAKDLLIYTNRPLSEISSLLCFSSQSHFSNAFKKKYHVSPLEFRKQRTSDMAAYIN